MHKFDMKNMFHEFCGVLMLALFPVMFRRFIELGGQIPEGGRRQRGRWIGVQV